MDRKKDLTGLQKGIKILKSCLAKEVIRFLPNLLMGIPATITNFGAAVQGTSFNIIPMSFRMASHHLIEVFLFKTYTQIIFTSPLVKGGRGDLKNQPWENPPKSPFAKGGF